MAAITRSTVKSESVDRLVLLQTVAIATIQRKPGLAIAKRVEVLYGMLT